MEFYRLSNLGVIKDCIDLTEQFSLDECLVAADKLCNAITAGRKSFVAVIRETITDKCLNEVLMLSVSQHGARNVLAALLYLQGDVDGYQLQLAAYKYDSKRASKELKNSLKRRNK